VPNAERIAVLYLGAGETGVAVGASVDPDAIITLDMGSRKTSTDFFKHSPPSPGELETAIQIVEDEVTRVLGIVGDGAELFTVEASVRELAQAAGQSADSDIVLSLEQIERTFERLAAVSLGRPAALEGLPVSNEFAATLLIVREFMHHLGFSRITVLA
jgi:exopolyphosphatase/pppGpp-phosphohydrolase